MIAGGIMIVFIMGMESTPAGTALPQTPSTGIRLPVPIEDGPPGNKPWDRGIVKGTSKAGQELGGQKHRLTN